MNKNNHTLSNNVDENDCLNDMATFQTHLEKLKKKWNKSKENKFNDQL